MNRRGERRRMRIQRCGVDIRECNQRTQNQRTQNPGMTDKIRPNIPHPKNHWVVCGEYCGQSEIVLTLGPGYHQYQYYLARCGFVVGDDVLGMCYLLHYGHSWIAKPRYESRRTSSIGRIADVCEQIRWVLLSFWFWSQGFKGLGKC